MKQHTKPKIINALWPGLCGDLFKASLKESFNSQQQQQLDGHSIEHNHCTTCIHPFSSHMTLPFDLFDPNAQSQPRFISVTKWTKFGEPRELLLSSVLLTWPIFPEIIPVQARTHRSSREEPPGAAGAKLFYKVAWVDNLPISQTTASKHWRKNSFWLTMNLNREIDKKDRSLPMFHYDKGGQVSAFHSNYFGTFYHWQFFFFHVGCSWSYIEANCKHVHLSCDLINWWWSSSSWWQNIFNTEA